jgi:hypothetical protein
VADKAFLLGKNGKDVKASYYKIFCSVSSPWNIDATKSLNFSFQKPVMVDKKFLKELLDRESEQFLHSLSKEAKEEYDIVGEIKHFEVVEKVIVGSFVNGYNVKNIFNKECSELELFMFFSVMSKDVERSLSKICLKHFVGADIEFHSAVHVYNDVLGKVFPDEKDFMLIHISGETTDITVVKNGIVTDNASFPLGRNFIARKIMEDMRGLTPNLALSMIRVHDEKNTSPKLSEKLKNILKQVEEDWLALFSESISDISRQFFMPSKAFILVGDGSGHLFADLITSKKIPVFGRSPYPINAEALDADLFIKYLNSPSIIERDPFLFAQTVFFNDFLFHYHQQN